MFLSGFVYLSFTEAADRYGHIFKTWRGDALCGGLSSQSLFRLALDGERLTGEEKRYQSAAVSRRGSCARPDGPIMVLADGANVELLRLTPNDSRSQ